MHLGTGYFLLVATTVLLGTAVGFLGAEEEDVAVTRDTGAVIGGDRLGGAEPRKDRASTMGMPGHGK